MHRPGGKASCDRARGLQRDTRLADTARAHQADQPHVGMEQQLADLGELALAADRLVGGRRQTPGEPGSGPVGAELGVVRQDHSLEPSQLRPRLDAELVDEHLTPDAHRLERLRLSAGSVQRDHQLSAQPLAQGMLGDQRLQLADQVLGTSAGELRGHPLLDRLEVELLEPGDLELCELIEAVVGEHVPAPEPQRHLEVGGGELGGVIPERHPRPAQKLLEAPGIDGHGIDVQGVAGRPVADERSTVPQTPAQPRDLLLQGLADAGGRLLAPERLDQLIRGDRVGGAEREHREEPALLRAFELHRVTRDLDLEVTQQPDIHPRIHASPAAQVSTRRQMGLGTLTPACQQDLGTGTGAFFGR